jgi:hypothetical protein
MRLLAALVLLTGVPVIFAQTASLSGRVSDESGAIVPGAQITVRGPDGFTRTATSGGNGIYAVTGLPSGDYSINASAPQMATAQSLRLALHTGSQSLDLQLKIAVTATAVSVNANAGPAVGTSASSNASATVLTGQDLESLADDPDDLQADLQALAGPSSGPDGNEIFIDGFSGGQLPPKQSIREVRLNQNPFAPEYEKMGLGRIEIFTKPGTDAWHATLTYNLGTDRLNSRNPYAAQKAPFLLQETENTVSGPISKRSSFTFDFARQAVDNGSVSNGVTLDPQTLTALRFTSVLKTPQRHYFLRPHIDYQLNESNYLSLSYTLARVNIRDAGIGAFDLISRGYRLANDYDTAQLIETSVHGTTINETRFQLHRWGYSTLADTAGPALQVLGAFNGGASSTPRNRDVQAAYEWQNTTSIVHGAHVIRFGARFRYLTDNSYWLEGFNGAFTFAGTLAPELGPNNMPILDAGGQAILVQIPAIEQYRRTLLFTQMGDTQAQIRSMGGGASQFTINAGNPQTNASRFDAAEFVGDDWRVRPNLTLNLGLRLEGQTNISDHFDAAPRIGIAWAPGALANKQGKTVLRAGYGIFYTRFGLSDSVTALRYNGIVQQQYVITDPDFFPAVPSTVSLGAGHSLQSIQEVDGHFRAPVSMQAVATVERQLRTGTTLAVTYTNVHSTHTIRSQDINAPDPGTYTGPETGVYPYPGKGPVFLVTSSGLYNQNQLSFNLNSKWNAAVSFYTTYVFNKSMSDTDGLGTFPGNPYNYAGEYGPAFNDIRHRILFGGTINAKWNLRFNPLISFQTGAPFDITTGNDPYGTTLFTARPGVDADRSKPGLIQTPYGLLDPNPTPGEQILPRNSGRGPFQIQTNLRVTKTWAFGEHGRYNAAAGISARNLLNHNNPGPIIGNITSPLFGQANQVAGGPNGEGFSENASNRRLEMQVRFSF